MCEFLGSSSSSSSHVSHSTDEYHPSASTSAATASRQKNIFKSPEVVGALDRGAVFVVGAVAHALGHNLSEITLSRSSTDGQEEEGRRRQLQKRRNFL